MSMDFQEQKEMSPLAQGVGGGGAGKTWHSVPWDNIRNPNSAAWAFRTIFSKVPFLGCWKLRTSVQTKETCGPQACP